MHWDNGWNDGPGGWGWLVMAAMMVAFWGGLAWIIASLIRHGGINRSAAQSVSAGTRAVANAEDILHERFARGEIDVEEYHQRLDAMRAKQLG
jgi:putative membrane protein